MDEIRVLLFELGCERIAVISLRLGSTDDVAELTHAEREVCQLALSGLSNAEIALRRGTSARTIANQLGSLYAKLGISSRCELASLFLLPLASCAY